MSKNGLQILNRPPLQERLIQPEHRPWLEKAIHWYPEANLLRFCEKAKKKHALLKMFRATRSNLIQQLERLHNRDKPFLMDLAALLLAPFADLINVAVSGKVLSDDWGSEKVSFITWLLWEESPEKLSMSLNCTRTDLLNRLQDQQRASQEQVLSLQRQMGELQARFSESQKAIEKLEAVHAEKIAELEASSQSLRDELNDKIIELQQQLQEQKETSIENLQQALEDAESRHQLDLENLKVKHQKEITHLNTLHEHTMQEFQKRLAVRHKATVPVQQSTVELDALRQRVQDLEQELELRPVQPAQTVQVTALEQWALMVNYAALGETSFSRIGNLIEVHRAYASKNFSHPLLQQASNINTLEEALPRGFVVVGVNSLLEDASALKLDRMVKLASLKREVLLGQLDVLTGGQNGHT